MTTQEIIEVIKGLSVLELNDLVKACEEEFGVSAAAGVVVAAAGADGAAAAEEKDSFNVELTEVGPNKVKVIKVVRELTGLGLKEAKDAVDGAPKVIKEDATKEEAEEAKTKLEAEGAKVTLKKFNPYFIIRYYSAWRIWIPYRRAGFSIHLFSLIKNLKNFQNIVDKYCICC